LLIPICMCSNRPLDRESNLYKQPFGVTRSQIDILRELELKALDNLKAFNDHIKKTNDHIKKTMISHFASIESSTANPAARTQRNSTLKKTVEEKLDRLERETAKMRQELAEMKLLKREHFIPQGLISMVGFELAKEAFSDGQGRGQFSGWVVCDGRNGSPNLTDLFFKNEQSSAKNETEYSAVYIAYSGKLKGI
jgi:hypothetical protein